MSESAEHIVSSSVLLSRKSRLEPIKRKLCWLKLVFPQEMPSPETVKLLHPKILRVKRAVHGIPKIKLKNVCFVEFETKRASDEALKQLHEKKIEGGLLLAHRVKQARLDGGNEHRERSSLSPRMSQTRRDIELIISHLPEDVHKADIKRAFPESHTIKIVKKGRLSIFFVPTLKTALSYLAKSVHMVKGHAVEVVSRRPLPTQARRRSATITRSRTRDEKMDAETIATDAVMDTSEPEDDNDTEMSSVEKSKPTFVVEECF